jgi:UTP--glucose-1-phosphate uridylyltransferase
MTIRTIRTAVIPAAGFGTRLLPASKSVPKELFPILDKPALQYVVEEALASGIDHLVVITSEGKDAIQNHLQNDLRLEAFLRERGKGELLPKVRDIAGKATVDYVTQEEQKGLGDAILCAREAVGDEPFAVLLGDALIVPDNGYPPGLAQLMDIYSRTGQAVVALREVPRQQVGRYGIVDGEPVEGEDPHLIRVRDMVEKPAIESAPSNLAVAARYIFPPALFGFLDGLPRGTGGEIQLTDAMARLAKSEGLWGLLWHARRYDIGNFADYLQCVIDFALADPAMAGELEAILENSGFSRS